MPAQENAAPGRHIYEVFNAGDLEQAPEEGTDDVEVVLVPFGSAFEGGDGFCESWRITEDRTAHLVNYPDASTWLPIVR